jgi:hypothetical protein
MKPATATNLLRRIRLLILTLITGLIISGATAIPLETELKLMSDLEAVDGNTGTQQSVVKIWISTVRHGIVETNVKYPFIAYGTDWLGFAHFVIAVVFIGPFCDPIKNIWVIETGMIACIMVVPFALIMGGFRGIPLGWRLLDCSFGIFGIIPLIVCRHQILYLERLQKQYETQLYT